MAPASEERFTRIYEAHYPAVLAYCARRMSRPEAEEVAHEVFMTLWRLIDSFEKELPLPWLYRVAYGAIRNRWRSEGRAAGLRSRLAGLVAESAVSTDVIVLRREQDRAVLAALGSLRPGDREVLRLSVWEDLSAPEIASVVGCSVPAAEQRLHRARQRLARALGPQFHATTPSPRSVQQGGTP